jgi:hypothetical protein
VCGTFAHFFDQFKWVFAKVISKTIDAATLVVHVVHVFPLGPLPQVRWVAAGRFVAVVVYLEVWVDGQAVHEVREHVGLAELPVDPDLSVSAACGAGGPGPAVFRTEHVYEPIDTGLDKR